MKSAYCIGTKNKNTFSGLALTVGNQLAKFANCFLVPSPITWLDEVQLAAVCMIALGQHVELHGIQYAYHRTPEVACYCQTLLTGSRHTCHRATWLRGRQRLELTSRLSVGRILVVGRLRRRQRLVGSQRLLPSWILIAWRLRGRKRLDWTRRLPVDRIMQLDIFVSWRILVLRRQMVWFRHFRSSANIIQAFRWLLLATIHGVIY